METPQTGGQGLVFLHRKIMELPFYRTDFEAMHLWVHLILKVNSAPGVVATEFGDQPVSRGQVITGRNTLSKETGLESDRVQYLLRKLEKLGMISCLSNRKFTLITVTKYDEYQGLNCLKNEQKNYQPNYQEDYQAKPASSAASKEGCTKMITNQIPTNNILNNISSTDVEESASAAQNPEPKKPSLSCEQVVEIYHRVLPEAQAIRILTDKRRNLIRSFWKKASAANRQLGGAGFSLQDWEDYLNYIASNCRWMLENRPDQRTGKTWRRKSLEYFLSVDVYAKTREGACDDL
ncbi:MAG: DNA replication protein [Leclercia sp.]